MRTPQGQEFAQTMMRGVMGQMYPDIAEKMGMSQQEADALFDLLLRQQQEIATDSIGLLTGSVQDPAARREIQRNLVEKQRAQEAELAAHLGARHGQWEDYQATAAARQQVNELRTALAGSDPLGDEQYDKLVAAFATETRRATEEVREWTYSAAAVDSPNMMQETMQRTVAAQRNLLEVARPHLNATQNAHYQRQMEQQMGMLQAVMGMMGGQGAPGAGQPPAPAAAPR